MKFSSGLEKKNVVDIINSLVQIAEKVYASSDRKALKKTVHPVCCVLGCRLVRVSI